MWQLIGVGLLAASLWAYVGLHNIQQQEIGAAKITAKLEKDRADVEADIARANQEGKLEFARLYEQAMKRLRQADAQAATDAIARREASDARANEDIEYALWRESRVPAFAADRLRLASLVVAHDASSRSVPSGTGVSPGQGVSAPAGGNNQSILGRIRSLIGSTNSPDVGGNRAVQ